MKAHYSFPFNPLCIFGVFILKKFKGNDLREENVTLFIGLNAMKSDSQSLYHKAGGKLNSYLWRSLVWTTQ